MPGSEVECEYTCFEGARTRASNLVPADYQSCDQTAPALAPAAGSTITIDGTSIECAPDCGDPQRTSIQASGMLAPPEAPQLLWFCLSRVEIGQDTRVIQGEAVERAVAWFVDGDAIISGAISFRGATLRPTRPAAAGSAEETVDRGPDRTASTAWAGAPASGHARAGFSPDYAVGGGGGGGHAARGGIGGTGRNIARSLTDICCLVQPTQPGIL